MGAGDMFACILPKFTAVCCLLVCRGLFVSFYYRLILPALNTSHYSHTQAHTPNSHVSLRPEYFGFCVYRVSLGTRDVRSVSARLSVCVSRDL